MEWRIRLRTSRDVWSRFDLQKSISTLAYGLVLLVSVSLTRANWERHSDEHESFGLRLLGQNAIVSDEYGWPRIYCKIKTTYPKPFPREREPHEDVEWISKAVWFDSILVSAICCACFLILPLASFLISFCRPTKSSVILDNRTSLAFTIGDLLLLFNTIAIVLVTTLIPVEAGYATPRPLLSVGGVTPPPIVVAVAFAVFSGLKVCLRIAACLRSIVQYGEEDPLPPLLMGSN